MAVNKVIYFGEVLVDMSQVTVKAETLHVGETALDASGELITGIMGSDVDVSIEGSNITLSSALSDGTYKLTYKNANGSTSEICDLIISGGIGLPDLPDEPVAPSFTNILPTALTPTNLSTVFNGTGYMDGKYASSSSPYYGSDSATVCTGAIPVTSSDVIYIKGITLNASTNSHCRVGIAQAHATNGGLAVSAVKAVNQMSSYATLETLGDQYYKLTFVASYFTSTFTRQPYFFLSGIGTGANLIITANEPIE